MRLISFSATVLSSLLSSAVLAQQPSDSIGHPPQIQGPPPISEPSATKQPTPAASAHEASQPASKGYMGAYGSPGPATPYFAGPMPEMDAGPGRAIAGPDGSTKIVKAVPCSTAAREQTALPPVLESPLKIPSGASYFPAQN